MLSGINPFKVRNKNKFEKLQMILEDNIEMQPVFTENACSLIQGLLTKKVCCPHSLYLLKPKLRLGYNGTEEIKEHPFFENIDWFKLERRGIDPPYKPRLNGDYDLSNIDRVIKSCDITRCSRENPLRRLPTKAASTSKM